MVMGSRPGRARRARAPTMRPKTARPMRYPIMRRRYPPRRQPNARSPESDADGGREEGAAPKLLSGVADIVSETREPREGRTQARSSGLPSRRAAVTYLLRTLAPGAS